jgi:hypothetical protein
VLVGAHADGGAGLAGRHVHLRYAESQERHHFTFMPPRWADRRLCGGPVLDVGWLLAGFLMADDAGVLTTHRWLGTGTVACAGLVLGLGEVSGRPDRRRIRSAFRAMLLVAAVLALVTAYLGGAIVYGLDHYAWPPSPSVPPGACSLTGPAP